MIYVTPGQYLSCTTGSAATPRKRNCHLMGRTVPPRYKTLLLKGLPGAPNFLENEILLPQRALALGAKVYQNPAGNHLPTRQTRNAVGDVSPARRGRKGLWKTHPARRTVASGNLEAAEKAETWRASLCGMEVARGRRNAERGAGQDACPGAGGGQGGP